VIRIELQGNRFKTTHSSFRELSISMEFGIGFGGFVTYLGKINQGESSCGLIQDVFKVIICTD
jgi:hypothetical protein